MNLFLVDLSGLGRNEGTSAEHTGTDSPEPGDYNLRSGALIDLPMTRTVGGPHMAKDRRPRRNCGDDVLPASCGSLQALLRRDFSRRHRM